MPAITSPTPTVAAAAALRAGRPRSSSGRRSSARRDARRAARRQRRLKRRLRAAGALAVWGLVAGLAVSGMYQWLGRDMVPTGTLAHSGDENRLAPTQTNATTFGARSTGSGMPGVDRSASTSRVTGGIVSAAPPAAGTAAAAASGMVMTPTGLAPAGSPAAVAAVKAARSGNLPFLPGSEVLDGGDAPNTGAGAPAGSWSATIATSEPLSKAVGYYREQLAQRRQPTDPPVNEMSPGPGQTLLSVASQQDGAHLAVWIGQADGKVLIRLVRSAPEGN